MKGTLLIFYFGIWALIVLASLYRGGPSAALGISVVALIAILPVVGWISIKSKNKNETQSSGQKIESQRKQ